MSVAAHVLLVAGAYLLGSVPFGLLLTRAFTGRDVRTVGSGNIGASNVARAAGKGVALLTLLLDAGKAAVPVLIALRLGRDAVDLAAAQRWAVVTGLAAFTGHLFPVWLRFRGGKGVASALGVFLVLAPWPALAGLAAFVVVWRATRVAALGSLSGAAACCAGTFVQELAIRHLGVADTALPWAALVLAGAVVLRHRDNIARLRHGAEYRV